MPIGSLPSSATRSKLADWLEVLSLTRPKRGVTRAELLGLSDFDGGDTQPAEMDPEAGDRLETRILDDEASEFAGDVFEELCFRAQTLADGYPFALSGQEPRWRLQPLKLPMDGKKAYAARIVYKFCLLASAIRDSAIYGVADQKLVHQIPWRFQAVATEAAAGLLGGESVSFGWPRPDGTAFLPALRNASVRLGMGEPLTGTPLWSSGREKDAGVDVIAWRGFADGRPGKLVLFGQVATGQNWPKKSVKADMPRFLRWFSKRPTEHYMPAIFIPFPQHHDCPGRRGVAFDNVAADEAWAREPRLGLVIDRMRIVGAASRRLAMRDNKKTLRGLRIWGRRALEAARCNATDAD